MPVRRGAGYRRVKRFMEQFSRHIRLPGFGIDGQKKISRAKVLIVGAGGLGSPAATYLAAANFGTIGIVDDDAVESSNLPRQILHTPKSVDEPKVISAQKRIRELAPDIKVNVYHQRIQADNVAAIINDYDIIIDGSDNFATKFLLNDACVIAGKPLIHGGVLRYNGQVMTIIPQSAINNQQSLSACYRCIFKEPPPAGTVPTCSEAGILSTVAGIIGLVQATEAIKYIAGIGQLLSNRLFIFDALAMTCRTVAVTHNPDCPVCGKNPTIKTVQDLKTNECH
jgi:adenylyltransferase/sulfurtransferase